MKIEADAGDHLVKTAVIHDWLIDMDEEEQWLASLCVLFPDADLYTLFYKPDVVSSVMPAMPVRPSRLQKLPGITSPASYMPLFPTMIEHIDLRGYDLVISNSRYFAKGVLTQPETCHISLLHPSSLFFWQGSPLEPEKASRSLPSVYPFLKNYYRIWDIVSSQRVDHFITTSHLMARHINKYYRRTEVSIIDPIAGQNTCRQHLYDLCYQIMDTFRVRQHDIGNPLVISSRTGSPDTLPCLED